MDKEDGLLLKELVYKPRYANAVEVRLYDTQKNMYKGANEWNAEQGSKYHIDNDFEAVTLENNEPFDTKKMNGTEYTIFTTVFLCKEKLSYHIILHEFGHATFNLFRTVYKFDCKFDRVRGTGFDEEEIFCYTQEAFFKMLLEILKKKSIDI
jgi:hypothetical protein